MAILVSPSNNTGWGLGLKTMYGGARVLSEHHPVKVVSHYRAQWGSKKGRTKKSTMVITDDPVADVVNAIGPGRKRRRRHRRLRIRGVIPSSRGQRYAKRGKLPRVRYHHTIKIGKSKRRKRSSKVKMQITDDPVADVVNAVAASAARRARKSGRRARHTKMRITSDPVADVVNAVAAASARRAARRASANIRRQAARAAVQNSRRNIYLVRNADGVRVPTTVRPS
ncbi:pVII [bottlenose dolphin adenovirus 2]|uniref:Pre-histone-like nucleoprotein n=1 Tax=bottlenose dolphin adenovirus 2 TaxID=2849592 RepID=A0A0M4MT88_9ADEN|nr:pVII [Bottlenose dolphin adenovirus 1]ALE15300.1 pVII [Bottlenose dolphin adenovirus 1]